MSTVHIRTRIKSETLTVKSTALKQFIGKDVEITISAEVPGAEQRVSSYGSMRGTVIRDDDPFAPAVAPEDWEAMQ
jgi:hypothetical protein